MSQKILSFIFIITSFCATAQTGMSFHYIHTIPLGDYKTNLTHNPSGINLEYIRQPFKNSRLHVGAALSVSMYQNENHSGNVEISDFRKAYVETNEDDCLYTYQGLVRYYTTPDQEQLRPYFQIQVGGATYFSTLSMTEDSEEAFEASTKHHGTTWLLGSSAGLAFKVYEALYIDLSLSYNASGKASYRTSPESMGGAEYKIDLSDYMKSSRVDHLAVKLGVNMLF